MNRNHPFSIRIFVADGDPDGLRVIERSNWNGRALIFPRPSLPEVKSRDEFDRTGVYILIGPRDDGDGELIYIGEGDPVKPRLESHFASKDFWNRAIFFVTGGEGQLNKAHVQYLEARLIDKAKEAKRLPIENKQSPNLPTLHEADRADMEVFLQHMLDILPLLGIHAFEGTPQTKPPKRQILAIETKGIRANGFESNQGFIVLKGSQSASDEVPSLARFKNVIDLRKALADSGVLVLNDGHYVFTQDYGFSSPSLAAMVVMGRSANGRTEWKDSNGRTLKMLQEEVAATNS